LDHVCGCLAARNRGTEEGGKGGGGRGKNTRARIIPSVKSPRQDGEKSDVFAFDLELIMFVGIVVCACSRHALDSIMLFPEDLNLVPIVTGGFRTFCY